MNIISQDKLQKIANTTGELVTIINDSVKWVDGYLKDDDKSETNKEIKKQRRTLKKIKEVVTEKPVIALFGASQVGKSYMANNLLYNIENKLEVYDHTTHNTIDFIKYINPEGNQNEATGAITRFTSTDIVSNSNLPVKVKLFGVKDIICILCDTYFYDFKDSKQLPKKPEIDELTNELIKYVSKNTNQEVLIDDDVYEVQEYLEKYFYDKSTVISLKDSNYWDFVTDNIANIDISNWGNVFNILWNNHNEISEIFHTTIRLLKDLKFNHHIYIGFDALLREKKKSIIDVATLNRFFEDADFIQVQMENGEMQTLSAGKLAFLTYEVILNISQSSIENRPFINNIDIIDFPGARTRPEITNFSKINLLEMLLRGKVSYLFNYYSANYKSNILSVCMRTAQTNVASVPRLVNQWIEDNLGTTIDERTHNITTSPPPLFVIFTWWNTQLNFIPESDSPDPSERIEKLFETRYKEEIQGSFQWHQNWVRKNGNTQKFSNFFLLRDFVRSKEIFKQDRNEEGIFVKEQEDGPFIDNAKQKFYSDYKYKFLEYHKRKNLFFENVEEAFEEASNPNKDGSEYIIKNLIPLSSNSVSVPIYINKLNKALTEVDTLLHKHYHSDKADEQIRKAAQTGSEIHARMNKVFGIDAYNFGSFIERLTVSENEILNFYHDLLKKTLLVEKENLNDHLFYKESSPRLNTENSYQENLEILRQDYNRDSIEDTEAYFTHTLKIDLNELFYGDLHNLKNKSLVLAEEARDFWFKAKLNVANFEYFIDLGFERSLLEKLFENLKASFEILKLPSIIAKNIRVFVDRYNSVDKAEDMISHMTAGIINEFVTSVGWSYNSKNQKDKIKETSTKYNLLLKFPEEFDVFEGKTHEDVKLLYEIMENLNAKLNQRPIDMEVIKNVPMMKNYSRWRELMKISFIANCDIPTYNIEGNRILGTILEKIKVMNFSL